MTERCIELLGLREENCLILDVGAGSGLSGEMLTEDGHYWIGLDISRSMLNVARSREVEGELYECDLGQGFNFLPGKFDAAISVSVIQWLCNVDIWLARRHRLPVNCCGYFGRSRCILGAGPVELTSHRHQGHRA